MTTYGIDVVRLCNTQIGDNYKFGGKPRDSDRNPNNYDCSGFTKWGHARNGLRIPDGAYYQWKKCRRITIDEASRIPGAFLFVGDGKGVGRDAIVHVALSRGDGKTTVEARSSRYDVGSWNIAGRFTFAGLMPGVVYHGKGAAPSKPIVTPHIDLKKLDANKLKALGADVRKAKKLVLNRGDSNGAVKWLQIGINNLTGGHLPVDGMFGPTTERAVKQFQAWFNLEPDGVVGPATWALIYP